MVNNNNNLIPKENFKKVEEVREIENEIPSYEEFLETYENDGKVNYDDLSGESVGEVKGYGPCTGSYCSCSNYELRQQLIQKQKDLDDLWERFKEYDEKWEDYKSAVNNYFSEIDREKNRFDRQIMDNPLTKMATSIIPMAGPMFEWKYDLNTKISEEWIESRNRENIRNHYNDVIVKVYNDIKDWYYRIRNR